MKQKTKQKMVTMLLLGILVPGLVSCGTPKGEQAPA